MTEKQWYAMVDKNKQMRKALMLAKEIIEDTGQWVEDDDEDAIGKCCIAITKALAPQPG